MIKLYVNPVSYIVLNREIFFRVSHVLNVIGCKNYNKMVILEQTIPLNAFKQPATLPKAHPMQTDKSRSPPLEVCLCKNYHIWEIWENLWSYNIFPSHNMVLILLKSASLNQTYKSFIKEHKKYSCNYSQLLSTFFIPDIMLIWIWINYTSHSLGWTSPAIFIWPMKRPKGLHER